MWEFGHGCEDPRVQMVGKSTYMLYTGAKHYQLRDQVIRKAVLGFAELDRSFNVQHRGYFSTVNGQESVVLSNKDSAFIEIKGSKATMLTRPDLQGEALCWRATADLDSLTIPEESMEPVLVPEAWEEKVGWSTNTVKLSTNEYLVGWHAVLKEDLSYKDGLALVNSEGKLLAISNYLLAPQGLAENYGDRPFVIFGDGLVKYEDYLIWVGGISDYGIGIFIIIIAIPTYWTWEDGNPWPEDVIYDHPTPLNQEGTLARLLESLKVIEGSKFNVLIITAVTNPQLEEAAEAKVNGILEPFRSSFPIAQFAASDLVVLRERLAQLGFPEEMISLRGYGNVRNIQLIAAHIIGFQVIVGLDDDEIVTDKGYLQKATEFIGKTDNGRFVGGVAPEGNPFHHKSAIMNAAIEVMEEKPGRLVETSFVFGGNMVIHRRMFEEVSFDPYITRGPSTSKLTLAGGCNPVHLRKGEARHG
jgi:predicted GH43/DUF377 family glycosyl hydrolase